ncbi:tail protein X [Serratia fonticola]|uniref:Tail protein X n=1 Tax=Serratia fonticola TaxID=47917 RepID=A0AAW3WQ42_SERFO|nr:tail protein X [Serratia fonticola]MBC3212916.1 tail protein X [Serratia fonticola]MDQ7210921.1 tail protein X [Serratia fonticola]NYA14480.1 tail protein X [Serratia fonticola]NYA34278.1 tail protein X [Serratia fonticola]HBE9080974.1 tail protein X [Serratia fonticola]
MQVFAQQGDTVDALCWRYFGRTQGVVEQVYSLNAGLADAGAILLHGQPVTLPDVTVSPQRETVNLWD